MERNPKKLKEILAYDDYVIPRYQRNYAWGKAEISQLIKDIDEFFSAENSEKKYYLGSLVCFKREDGDFELIDGQQRHTTITLINLVLKNWDNVENVVASPNLKFDCRKKIQNAIENIYKIDKADFQKKLTELNMLGLSGFKDAIDLIQEELRGKDIQKFAKNFYENVYLFRVEVPEETDLNHYFEIMNNRGEQLEKHEIVKALLMWKISDKNQQAKFATIWDACANMNDYVYFNFTKEYRQKIFDNNGKLKNNINLLGEDDSAKHFENCIEEKENNTLISIIENYKIQDIPQKDDEFIKNKYKSIIDFPNFLLQVLKINNEKIPLDDKKLLEQFKSIEIDPREFIVELLRYRVLFDEYVIKKDLADADENKQNWGIRKLNSDYETTIKTFEDDDELMKLQVMLYYSNPTNTYNDWLQQVLKNTDFTIEKFTEKLWNIAKNKFNKEKLSYPEISIFNLYFIDFLLWKLYKTEDVKENLKSLKNKIDKLKDHFKNFKFRQISSREHLLSQEHANRYTIKEEIYNGIGNICLISTTQNSAGNKENPIDKKKMFKGDNLSLKRLIMFESFENDKWEVDQICKHKDEILALINSFVDNI
ncbi:MAG: DUF262 domain-containing protein [Bacteroidales bacterium]